jgi:hypothetical protein
MTSPKASGTKRVVRVKKCVDEMLFAPGDFHITGYTGSAAKLKKLVEIAAMDECAIKKLMSSAIAKRPMFSSAMEAVIEAIGLTQPKARAGRRSRG